MDNADLPSETAPSFQPLNGIFEPSAVQPLPDDRFLVVEDDKHHPFSLINIGADGHVECAALKPGLLQFFSDFWKLDDLSARGNGKSLCEAQSRTLLSLTA